MKYLVEWETCYCEDYPEQSGSYTVEANNIQEVVDKFNMFHAVIINISEVN